MMLNVWVCLVILPAAYGASAINTTFSSRPIVADLRFSAFPNAIFTCVNASQHPDWAGEVPTGCNEAMSLIADRTDSRRYTSYTFWSKRDYPDRRPQGWPLPQGAMSG
ncbi:hypothetical protein N7G274_006520 [Stereocaulon virgatum]|uniref:Uncharacterized protein n=1 Tax=Stereocaulon virgatum TaxID=373712 RepID=A0ABR4A5A7_9LECA